MPPKTLSKRYLETQPCIIPDTVPEDVEMKVDPAFIPRSPASTIIEPVTATQTCPSVIQSGVNKGKICGKPVFTEGLCRRHHTLSNEERPSKKARLTEPLEGRCRCKTQKGFFCGVEVKDGGLYCKRHLNCLAVVGGSEPEPPAPEPVVPEPEPEDPQEMRLQLEPELGAIADEEPVPPIEADLFQRPEWTTHFASDTASMMAALQHIEVVDLDVHQLEALEANIRACFA